MIYSDDDEEEGGLSLVPDDEDGVCFLLLSSSMRSTCSVTIGLKKRYPTPVNNSFISFIQFLLIPDNTPNITANTGALVALILSWFARNFSPDLYNLHARPALCND